MIATPDTSVREIVTHDFRAAAVFEHFGIDFCCGGRRTLAEACRARNVNPLDVLIEVNQACERADAITPHFDYWEPDALIAYIVRYHHAYVRRVLPAIARHIERVAGSHGVAYPALVEVAAIVDDLAETLPAQLQWQEEVLFPYVEQLQIGARLGEPIPPPAFGSVERSIAAGEEEHERALEATARIRELTDGYVPPAGACTTFLVCLRELEEFEHDLHIHAHLENNLLFPKARVLAEHQPVGA